MRPFPSSFTRHLPRSPLPSLAAEAGRLKRFVPPFRFTSFFCPEDTLLCVIAAESALETIDGASAAEGEPFGVVELTAGSGLVGLRVLDLAPRARLVGVDVDRATPPIARANAERLGLGDRAHFARVSVWDASVEEMLRAEQPALIVCNPPYIPEPPGGALPVEAGAGDDGAAHVRRAIDLAHRTRPAALALSWCSLSDPAGVVAYAERAGYRLASLFAVAIADGEYSGVVHRYLRTLPTAFLSEEPDVVATVAPDGAARFAYLLLAGVFVAADEARAAVTTPAGGDGASDAPLAVERMMRDFVRRGPEALVAPAVAAARAPFPVAAWLLDRWDELALRAYLHGALDAPMSAVPTAPGIGVGLVV
ncbi:MAG TPA: methyltransferase [Gemmatimonadaceae bacterium]|nr:methyltransferase [Gemmatimonadaceae bacterium]